MSKFTVKGYIVLACVVGCMNDTIVGAEVVSELRPLRQRGWKLNPRGKKSRAKSKSKHWPTPVSSVPNSPRRDIGDEERIIPCDDVALAAQKSLLEAVVGNREKLVRMLLDGGADPHGHDEQGRTLLQITDNLAIVRLLIEARERLMEVHHNPCSFDPVAQKSIDAKRSISGLEERFPLHSITEERYHPCPPRPHIGSLLSSRSATRSSRTCSVDGYSRLYSSSEEEE